MLSSPRGETRRQSQNTGTRSLRDSGVQQESQIQGSHQQWAKNYLSDLRAYKTTRPGGARPLPARLIPAASTSQPAKAPRGSSDSLESLPRSTEVERSASAMSQRKHHSTTKPTVERPLFQVLKPGNHHGHMLPEKQLEVVAVVENGAKLPYYERGQRWMEKKEAQSLRAALQEMDHTETRLHEAAQAEASELVLKHLGKKSISTQAEHLPYRYTQHLRKGSHAKEQSISQYEGLILAKGGVILGNRSCSDGSASNKSDSSSSRFSKNSSSSRYSCSEGLNRATPNTLRKKYPSVTLADAKSLFKRRSGPRSRNTSATSGQSLFSNPDDSIYEEPEDGKNAAKVQIDMQSLPVRVKSRNTSGSQKSAPLDKDQRQDSIIPKVDMHLNSRSHSHDPFHVNNSPKDQTKQSTRFEHGSRPSTRDGVEIRTDEIRAATSPRFRDRMSNLPTPSVVSDQPGRPIVSFDHNYQVASASPTRGKKLPWLKKSEPPSATSVGGTLSSPSLATDSTKPLGIRPLLSKEVSSAAVATQVIPKIEVSGDSKTQNTLTTTFPAFDRSVPQINTSIQQNPILVTHDRSSAISNGDSSRLSKHSHASQTHSTPSHWSLASNRATAQCAACALPISGRTVGASNQRYHPACFSCYQCGELLECVAFYPEPAMTHDARLRRINARRAGLPIPRSEASGATANNGDQVPTEEQDGDGSPRFYCHLDFHELFSPRCRSCKTPIEGEVVLACGGEWHVGHFFCAECGDPFEPETPFVEKEGFAWCVRCHAGRFSGRCAGCRKPIVDLVVKALGKEWHDACFVCQKCHGSFDDGRFFESQQADGAICVECEEKRLKA